VPRFLALDWDQNQLVVVAGAVAGGKAKVQRAVAWREEGSPNPADAAALGKRLRERLKQAHIAPAPVLACLGRDRLILKEVRYPAVPEAEEAAVVRFQAVKELTDAADEVVLDYVAAGPANGGGERRALVLVARKELVHAYKTLCQAAGLTLAALTPRPFGLAACLRRAAAADPPEEEGAVAGAAVGERWAEFCVLRGGDLLLTRSMAAGPNLAAEVRRNLTVYAGGPGRPPVRALYLAGVAPEVRERLGDLLELPLKPFDPLASAEAPDLPAENRGAFAGAAGLLYARAEAAGLPVNFVKPREPKPPADPNRRRLVLAGAAAAVVALVGLWGCWAVYGATAARLAAVEDEKAQLENQLAESHKEMKLYKALDDWDNVVWPDELYDLTYNVPDPNALRVTSVTAEPLPRTAKARFTGRLTIKGTLLDTREPRHAIDQLLAAYQAAGYYSPESPKILGNQFTLVVNVERRPPADYHDVLPPAPEKQRPDFGFGGDF
jgi:Tfp pilus assembly PilM family ATPase